MSLCIIAAGKTTILAATAFTLSWMHSVEHTAWQEDWQLTERGLEIVEARIKGSGAGMDPPEGSVFAGGWWHYKPDLPPLPQLNLATSGATEPWQICTSIKCLTISAEANPGGATVARCSAPSDDVAERLP